MVSDNTKFSNNKGKDCEFSADRLNKSIEKRSIETLMDEDDFIRVISKITNLDVWYIEKLASGDVSQDDMVNLSSLTLLIESIPEEMLFCTDVEDEDFFYGDEEIGSLKRVSDALKKVLWKMESTHGFADVMAQKIKNGVTDVFDSTFTEVHDMINEATAVLVNEEFYLEGKPVFKEIISFWNSFLEEYDEIVSNAFPEDRENHKFTKEEVDNFLQSLRCISEMARKKNKILNGITKSCILESEK